MADNRKNDIFNRKPVTGKGIGKAFSGSQSDKKGGHENDTGYSSMYQRGDSVNTARQFTDPGQEVDRWEQNASESQTEKVASAAGSAPAPAQDSTRHVTAKVSASDNGYDYSQELKGRTAEDLAGKKSAAEVSTSGGKWEAAAEATHTSDKVSTAEISDSGNKHRSDDGRSKTYHTVGEEDNSHFRASSGNVTEDQSLNAQATDSLNRSLVIGDGINHSALEKGTIRKQQADKRSEGEEKKVLRQTAVWKEKNDESEDNGAFYSDSVKAPKQTVAKRIGQNARKLADVLTEQSGAPEGEDIGAAAMRQSGNVIKGQVSAVAGAVIASKAQISADRAAEARTAIVTAKNDLNDHAGFRVFKKGEENDIFKTSIEAAESASGKRFVTGSDNSFGSITKDIKNNLYIIDMYFGKKGALLSSLSDDEIRGYMRKRVLPTKTGFLQLSDSDVRLLEERQKLTRRRKALKAAGTWRDNGEDLADTLLKGTDAGDEIVEAKNNVKQAVNTVQTVKRGTKVAASAGNKIVKGVFRGAVTAAEGGILAGSTAAHAATLLKGTDETDPKLIKKWKADEKAKFKERNAKIRAEAGKVKKKPGTEAARGMKKAYDKTIGKTAFGKRLSGSKAADNLKRGQKWFAGRRNAIAKKNREKAAAKAAKKAAGKDIVSVFGRAVNYVKAGAAIAIAVVVAGSTVIIILTSGISAVMPMGADKANFEAGELTMWENSKENMNLELQSIASECTDFVSTNYRALRKRRRGKALPDWYETNFFFNGFVFDGPRNNVSDRDQGDAGTTDTGSGYHGGDGQLQEENANTTIATSGNSDSIQEEADMSDGDYMKKYQARENRTLTRKSGKRVNQYGVLETFYNMDMANCAFTLDQHVKGLYGLSDNAHEFAREPDGVKMYGDPHGVAYVMVAADLSIYPKGTIVRTSLGPGIVCDAGGGVTGQHFDIAVDERWHSQVGGKNSGTVDTWGSDINTGAVFANGAEACGPNYLRGILSMATAVTGNEDNKSYRSFYSTYCVHLIRNSWNYTKYVAATNWKRHQETEEIDKNEKKMHEPWDDLYADEVMTYGGVAFDIKVVNKEYNDYKHQISTTYAVTCHFLDCGLWGDDIPPKMFGKKNYSDDGGTAGTAIGMPNTEASAAGKFDTETYQFETTDELGNEIKNEIADNDYIHSISLSGTSEYDPDVAPGQVGYEHWDGWEDKSFLTNDEVIYESGANTSLAEGTYDLSDDDYADMGISLGGLYNVSAFAEDGGVGGQAADPLSEEEIQQILANVRAELGDDKALEERLKTIEGGLRLIGKATYDFGAMHGSYNGVSKGSGNLDGFGNTSDCSGYISYLLWQGGAKYSDGVNSCATFVNKGKAVDPSDLKPGDIIVKNNGKTADGKWDSHVVMYIGKTSLGNFTVAECTRRNGKSGPQLNGYDSWGNFQNRRGADYSHIRRLF